MRPSITRRDFLKAVAAGTGALLPTGAAAQQAPGTTGKVKLSFMWPFVYAQTAQRDLVSQFNEQSKTIEVEDQIIPQTQVLPKLTIAFSGGTGPDVLAVPGSLYAQFAASGWLENIESRWKETDFDKDLLPPAIKVSRIYNNTAYGVAYVIALYAMFYNKEHFKEANLSGPPKTLDEFRDDARKLTNASKNRYGYYLLGGSGWAFQQWSTWMIATGGLGVNNTFFDANNKCILDGPKHVAGVERWLALYQTDKVSPPASATGTFNDAANAFNAGQVSIVFGWLPYIATLSKGIGADKFEVAMPPGGEAGQFIHFGGGDVFAISSQSKNKDAAWEFVKFMMSARNISEINKEAPMPANVKVLGDKWLDSPHLAVPKVMVRMAANLALDPVYLGDYATFNINYSPEQIQKALLGQQTAQQFATNVAKFLTDSAAKKPR
jgi:multiple sugar transport system substrate-binding protein